MDYWAEDVDAVATFLGTDPVRGLSADERARRVSALPPAVKPGASPWRILLSQFRSPILLLLVAAACLSFALRQPVDASVVMVIIVASALVSFRHEYRANSAVADLLSLVETKTTVLVAGEETLVPAAQIVAGDVVALSAGNVIPADGILVEATNLFADEAALTGESFPVEKKPGLMPRKAPLASRTNILYSGTHVTTGAGRMIACRTGLETELGHIAGRLKVQRPEAEFERGLRHFGLLLVDLTIVLTLGVFAVNTWLGRPILESFLFSLALAVGLTPQLLPAIVSVNLSHGAVEMAKEKMIVKRLAAIENLGSMDVLCSDKTGTLTTGVVTVHGAYSPSGEPDPEVLRLAQINAVLQGGYRNPIDEALAKSAPATTSELLGEIPYDFQRKRLTVVVNESGPLMISKGALEAILTICDGRADKAQIQEEFRAYSEQGFRVLGIATGRPAQTSGFTIADEQRLTFRGFIVLEDPLRPEIAATLQALNRSGVELKVITGDNRLAASRLALSLGLSNTEPVTGTEVRRLSDAALVQRVRACQVFAEIEPNQKERLILALKKSGQVVGYIGDGINDAAALHAADASISVANAVDVAKKAADFVMLEPGLQVVVTAIREGRKTFTNTMKYVFMATSANFGNMFSLAAASMLVPFLPLLPKQVLAMNFLTDVPEMFIATDNVDPERLQCPQRWNLRMLKRFMIVFGLISSAFDITTFLVLLALKAPEPVFRTAWFTESIISAALIVLVLRTRRPFSGSAPGKALLWATVATICLTLLIPLSPLAKPLGLEALPLLTVCVIGAIVIAYVGTAEVAKRLFFRITLHKAALRR